MPRGVVQRANPKKDSRKCNKKFNPLKIMKKFAEKKNWNRRVYLAVISSVAPSCGGKALSQTNNMSAAGVTASDSSTNVTDLGNITVVGQLDQARNQISPDLGASAYTISKDQIAAQAQGGNAPMSHHQSGLAAR
jgi:hypothetical protein